MANETPRKPITGRQADVLALIAQGYSNRAIAEHLGISENGVKGHVARLLAKFEVPTRAALVSAAGQDDRPLPRSSALDTLDLIRRSLEEVIGTTATSTLLRRASRHAGILNWETGAPTASMPIEDVSGVVRALWPLLIEMTGEVLVSRLEARGLNATGGIDAQEIAKWMT